MKGLHKEGATFGWCAVFYSKATTPTLGYISSARIRRFVGYSASLLFLLLATCIISPLDCKPNTVEAASSYIEPSLTFISTSDTALVNLNVINKLGTFATSSNDELAIFSLSTTNFTGYTLNLRMGDASGTTSLSDGINTIPTISASTTAENFNTNTWGIMPSKFNGDENTANYYPASSAGFTMNATNCANNTPDSTCEEASDHYTIGLGVKADYTLPSGTYLNTTFVIEYVANLVNYAIYYDANVSTSGDAVANMPTNQAGTGATISQESIALMNDIPTRAHYDFLGWCEGIVTATTNPITGATTDTCTINGTGTGTIYNPGDNFYFNANTANTVTLYAMWEQRYYMQDFTSNMCTAMPNEMALTLYDKRDEKNYTIAKIDEECWMTKNLDLASGTELYSSTSNVPSGYDEIAYFTLPNSADSFVDSASTVFVHNSNNNNCDGNTPCYSYYTYSAATVGTNPSAGDAEYDICPKGWRLPSRTNFSDLKDIYVNGEYLTGLPFLAVYAGMYADGGFNDYSGARGFYWSSTSNGTDDAYTLDFYTSVSGANSGPKARGRSVRCIVKYPYMQNQTSTTMADLLPNTNNTVVLADKRDNTKYTVGKLGDNNYWMLKNLALDIETLPLAMLQGETNATNYSLNYLKGISVRDVTNDPDGKYATSAVSTVWNNINDQNNTATHSYSDPRIYKESKNDTNMNDTIDAATNWKYGIYYNYCASSAGSYCFGSGVNAGVSTGNAMEDVCPIGWRLPTGGLDGEYNNLYANYYNSVTSFRTALQLPLSGYVNKGTVYGRTGNGHWRTSTRDTNSNMFNLRIATSEIVPVYDYYRYDGYSIRCVLKNDYMQYQTNDSLAELMPNEGDTTTLYDKRDSNSYTIAKINGRYWMTQNLDLAGGTTLTPELSNVSDNYTLPASSTTGFSDNATAYVYNSNSTDCSSTSPCYSYYSYAAATANVNPSSGSTTSDICPKGWRLPSNAELTSLKNSYPTGTDLTTGPFLATYAGRYENDTFLTGGTNGSYWASETYSNSDAYRLRFGAEMADFGYREKHHGGPVRCIAGPNTISDITYMQELTPQIAENTAIGTIAILRDSRDEQPYTVGKLADENIWLLDNFALDLTDQNTVDNISADNTNATNMSISYLKNGGGETSGRYAVAGLTMTNWTSGSDYSTPLLNANYRNSAYSGDTLSAEAKTWKYGIYYNFCAASAGSYCYNSNSPVENSTEDICPKGWHIPTSGNNGEYSALYSHYNSYESTRLALHLPLSGWLWGGSPRDQGDTGGWFSSTRANEQSMYGIHVEPGYVTVTRTPERIHGNTIRCVFDSL